MCHGSALSWVWWVTVAIVTVMSTTNSDNAAPPRRACGSHTDKGLPVTTGAVLNVPPNIGVVLKRHYHCAARLGKHMVRFATCSSRHRRTADVASNPALLSRSSSMW